MTTDKDENKRTLNIAALKRGESVRQKFHFIKSNYFRVVHADGVWGGLTPHRYIQIAFFNERHAIPQVVNTEIALTGVKELSQEGKIGIVREMEVEIIMNIEAAKSFRKWLDDKIAQAEELDGLSIQLQSQADTQLADKGN